MYTILINDDKTLSTSIRTNLLHNTTTDEIWFLYKPKDYNDDLERRYTANLHYEDHNITKTSELITDTEPYKNRMRFKLPTSYPIFQGRGSIKVWIELFITTVTTVIDPDTGEPVTEETTESFSTLPTTIFIYDSIRKCHYCKDENNTIRITRGDSLIVNVYLTDNCGFPYTPIDGDEVWFTVKKNAKSEDVLIRKAVDLETLTVEIIEEDTKNLAFGEYKYEVEVIVTSSNDHYTVIKNAPFIITEELH